MRYVHAALPMLSLVTTTGLADLVRPDLAWVPPELGQTWVEIDGVVYGARPDERGPIGGGQGYAAVLTNGDYRVVTLDELREALATAQPGEVVFVASEAEIDCTTLVYTENLVLEVPAGVTLASNRGADGSPGALIYSTAYQTRPLIRALGPDVRISGLRIRGPDPERRLDHHRRAFDPSRGERPEQSAYYYRFPVSAGVATEFDRLTVDNCELSGWSHAAISLNAGVGHHIHHCLIHHNQYNGLGYGIVHGDGERSESLIECNLFDWNRHSIAGTGRPGNAYEARNNVELGVSLSHNFDMHGGRDRNDGTDIAGDWIRVHHNTFRGPDVPAVVIRGTPQQVATIERNWFWHGEPGPGVVRPWPTGDDTRVECGDNAYGAEAPAVR